jgi:hypothetical protein
MYGCNLFLSHYEMSDLQTGGVHVRSFGGLPAITRLRFSDLSSHDLYVLLALLGFAFAAGAFLGSVYPQLLHH